MQPIIEIKVSLMEKEKEFILDNDSKGNYIIKSTGIIQTQKYLDDNNIILDNNDYLEYIYDTVKLIYTNLIEKLNETVVDTVGMWITFDDKSQIENSMDISTLNAIGEYNTEITPIVEFTKMLLNINEETS